MESPKRIPPSKELIDDIVDIIVFLHKSIGDLTEVNPKGIRELSGLEHAAFEIIKLLSNPKTDPINVGVKILNLLVKRHYFWDANKRIGYIFAKSILDGFYNLHLKINYENAEKFLLRLADETKHVTDEETTQWLKTCVAPLSAEEKRRLLDEDFRYMSSKFKKRNGN